MVVRWSSARAAEAVRGTPSGLTMTGKARLADADVRTRGSAGGRVAHRDMGLVVAERGAGRDCAGANALVLCTCRARGDSLGSREVQDGAVAAVVHVLHGRTPQLAVLPGKLPR